MKFLPNSRALFLALAALLLLPTLTGCQESDEPAVLPDTSAGVETSAETLSATETEYTDAPVISEPETDESETEPPADNLKPEGRAIPYAPVSPGNNGRIVLEEWAGALEIELRDDDPSVSVIREIASDLLRFRGAKIRFMWNEAGLWFALEVNGRIPDVYGTMTEPGNYAEYDALAFEFYPEDNTGEPVLFFGTSIYSADGYKDISGSWNNKGKAKIRIDAGADNYTITGFFSAEELNPGTPLILMENGTAFYMKNSVNYIDGDNEWSVFQLVFIIYDRFILVSDRIAGSANQKND